MLSELKKCHSFLSQLNTPRYKTIEALPVSLIKKIIHASIKEKQKTKQQAKTRLKKMVTKKQKKKQVKPLG